MSPDEARQFVRDNHRGVLITSRGDGRPQASPVVAAVDDDGHVVISTRETAVKAKNAERDPQVSYLGITDGFFGPWVRIDGRAHLVHLPEAMEGLVDYYRQINGEHDDWDDYRAAMERERRLLLRITVDDAGPDISG